MLTLAHISDLHFGKPFLPHVAEALLAELCERRPDVIVVSGDLTQRAKRREFVQARDFLSRLPEVPRVVIPGNHDVPLYRFWERLFTPHDLYREYIDERLDTVLRLDEAVIVGLDSTDPYGAISNGRLSERQLAFCEQAFEGVAEGVARIVVLHHHVIPAPTYEVIELMPKAQRALESFTRFKVDLIMAGHLHRAYVGNSLDVYAGEDRGHGIVVAQCGTSTSRRGRGLEREKNTYNWLSLNKAGVEVSHHMYFSDRNGFAPLSRHAFAWPRRGWLEATPVHGAAPDPGRAADTDPGATS